MVFMTEHEHDPHHPDPCGWPTMLPCICPPESVSFLAVEDDPNFRAPAEALPVQRTERLAKVTSAYRVERLGQMVEDVRESEARLLAEMTDVINLLNRAIGLRERLEKARETALRATESAERAEVVREGTPEAGKLQADAEGWIVQVLRGRRERGERV